MNLSQLLGPKEDIRAILHALKISPPQMHPNPLVHKIIESMRDMFFDKEEGLYTASNYSPECFVETNALMAIALQKAGYYGESIELLSSMKEKFFDNSEGVFKDEYRSESEPTSFGNSLAVIALKEASDNSAYTLAEKMKIAFAHHKGLLCVSTDQNKQVISGSNAAAILAYTMLKDPFAAELAKNMKKHFVLENNIIWNGWGSVKEVMVPYHFLSLLAFSKAGEDISPYLEAAKAEYSENENLFFEEGAIRPGKRALFYDNAVASIALQSIKDPRGKLILDSLVKNFLKENSLFQDKKPSNEDEFITRPNAFTLLALMGYNF